MFFFPTSVMQANKTGYGGSESKIKNIAVLHAFAIKVHFLLLLYQFNFSTFETLTLQSPLYHLTPFHILSSSHLP